jgi:hypothetical protein
MSDTGIEFEEDSFMKKRRSMARDDGTNSKSKMVAFLQKHGVSETNAHYVLIGVAVLCFLISFLLILFHFFIR